jgi:hypothetical protein
MVTTSVAPIYGTTYIAQAATIKISNKSITLEVGKTKTLKITGTSKKVTWSSSKKAIATVSSKGKVTAKAAGTSTITANIAGKKLTCKVTVKEPVNPYLKNAPFDAREIQIEGINLVMPSDWDGVLEEGTQNDLYATLSPLDTSLSSSIIIHITIMDEKAPEYNALKEELSSVLTQEYYQQLLVEALDDTELKMNDFKQSDFEASSVKALKVDYNFTTEDVIVKQANYYFYLNNYFLDVTAADASELDLEAIVEYMLSSIVLK